MIHTKVKLLKFELEGYLEATSELEPLREKIGTFIQEANAETLRRGVPKGASGARVTEWRPKNRRLEVKIEGTRFLTAHDAFKRLKNHLIKRLAKERIGIRRLFIDRYLLEVEASKERVKIIDRYPLVKGAEMLDGEARITLERVEEAVIDRGDIPRLVRFIAPEARTIQRELARKVGLVIRKSKERRVRFREDPTEIAPKLGWAERFPGRGQWLYTPPYATLQTTLKDIMVEEVARPLGFVEVLFPKLIPIKVAFTAKKIQGEPGGMFYVCPPRVREKEEYIPLQIKAEITGELPMDELTALLEEPGYVLDPAQCTPFYQMYRNKTIRKDDLPIKVYEYGGPTYRYEAGGVRGLERLCEFWRLEHVWLGTPELVESIRLEAMEKATEVVDRYLDLEWRLQFAGDTFYLAEDQKIDDDVTIPEAPKHEWQFYLPFKGHREARVKDVWLACGSFNSHGNHYTKHFNIKCTTGETLWTGCFGVGLSRLTTAFLAQHGFDFDEWPGDVKRRIGRLPSIPKPV